MKKSNFNFKSKFWARDKEAVILLVVIVAFAATLINHAV